MSTAPGGHAGLDAETLGMILESIGDFVEQNLPQERLLELDHTHEFPEESIRGMCGELGVLCNFQLVVFIFSCQLTCRVEYPLFV